MSNRLPCIHCMILLIPALMSLGCGSGQDRNTATVKAATAVPVDVTKGKHELDQVVNALIRIRDADENADLHHLFIELKTHASRLDGVLAEVGTDSDTAIASGKSQIDQWHKDADAFTDPDLRNASNARQGELRQSVDALSSSSSQYKGISDAYDRQLSQTIKALDLDLSQPGIQSIKPVVSKLVEGAGPLCDALTDISTKSKAVNAVTSP